MTLKTTILQHRTQLLARTCAVTVIQHRAGLQVHPLRSTKKASYADILRPEANLWQARTEQAKSGSRLYAVADVTAAVDIDTYVQEARQSRQQWLEDHSLQVLKTAVEKFEHPVFPCALIAGDVVILDLLSRLGYLQSGKVKVLFVDTFHLFDETHSFLHTLEEKYGFKALEYHAEGFANKEEYKKKHGSDLYLVDVGEYDRICKVEPFNRALVENEADIMINGRRQDHGFERAHLEVFEDGKPLKCNPLAWWTFKDCFDYLQHHKLQYHPLHDQGFPSVGDVHSTIPVPKERWFEYAGERSGRFQGMTNEDGSTKTECGIHVAGTDANTGLSNIRA